MKKTVSILVLLCMAVSLTLMLSGCVKYTSGVVVSSDFAGNYTVKVTKETTTNALGIESVSTISYEARFTKDGVTKLTTELNGMETEILQKSSSEWTAIGVGVVVIGNYKDIITKSNIESDYTFAVNSFYDSEKKVYNEVTGESIWTYSGGQTDIDLKVNKDGMPETLSYIETSTVTYGSVNITETEKLSCEFSEYGKTKLHTGDDPMTISSEKWAEAVEIDNYTAVMSLSYSKETIPEITFKMADGKLWASQALYDSSNQLCDEETKKNYEEMLFPMKGEFEKFIYDPKSDRYISTEPISESTTVDGEIRAWTFNNVVVKFTEFGELESFSADCTTVGTLSGMSGVASITQSQISVKFSDVGTTVVDG